MDFKLRLGGKSESPQELTQVSDWGERTQPTTPQLEIRRVYDVTPTGLSAHPPLA